MDFFTPGWTKALFDSNGGWAVYAWRRHLCRVVCAWVLLAGLMPLAWAQTSLPVPGAGVAGAESSAPTVPVATGSLLQELRVERTSDGVALSIQLDLALPAGVEDVLLKAVPVYFVMQADVLRERWYWSDQRVGRQARTYRLAYQPLTRQWRLSMATGVGPGATLEYALHQNHASLSAALLAMSRQYQWLVAEASQLPAEGVLWVDFRFSLDAALLPKPFQFGVGTGGLGLDVRRRVAVPAGVSSTVSSIEPGLDQ